MNKKETNILLWVFIYWLLCINTLYAIASALYLGVYSFSQVVPASILAAVCAATQVIGHYLNGQKALPIYTQFIQVYLSMLLFLVVYELNELSLSQYTDYAAMIFMGGLIFSLPLMAIAYFVRIRILKYAIVSESEIIH